MYIIIKSYNILIYATAIILPARLGWATGRPLYIESIYKEYKKVVVPPMSCGVQVLTLDEGYDLSAPISPYLYQSANGKPATSRMA